MLYPLEELKYPLPILQHHHRRLIDLQIHFLNLPMRHQQQLNKKQYKIEVMGQL
jgi:hypothetical protein